MTDTTAQIAIIPEVWTAYGTDGYPLATLKDRTTRWEIRPAIDLGWRPDMLTLDKDTPRDQALAALRAYATKVHAARAAIQTKDATLAALEAEANAIRPTT